MKNTDVNPNAGGVDIGADKFYACAEEGKYKVFRTYHEDCLAVAAYFREHGVTRVAFESTGVYWLHLKDVLEAEGFEVMVVNPQQTKRRKCDPKSDASDCQWIRHLLINGMLRPSFFPDADVQQMRAVHRMREDHVRSRAQHESVIIKVLTMMNVRLKEVISSVTSVSGQKILRAIIAGERDAQALLCLAHESIKKKKSQEMLKALAGNYADHYVFMLSQAFSTWEFFEAKIDECDKLIAAMIDRYNAQQETSDIEVKTPPKASRTNNAPKTEGLHDKLVRMSSGRDMTSIPFISDYTQMKVLMEVGIDFSSFPTEKHFVSWAGLAPRVASSGASRRSIFSPATTVGLIIRQAASSALKSKHNSLGEFGRRIAIRKDKKAAIKAVARKIAVYIYRLMRYGEEYVEQGVQKHVEQIKAKELKMVERLAQKHGLIVSDPAHPDATASLCA